MNLKHLLSRSSFRNASKLGSRILFPYPILCDESIFPTSTISSLFHSSASDHSFSPFQRFKSEQPASYVSTRFIHTGQEAVLSQTDDESEDDAPMNEFLSRFVWIMRRKLNEAYPDYDKKTIDGMLLIIVENVISEINKRGLEGMLDAAVTIPSQDLSEDLWITVWEVGNSVLEEMEKAKNKEKLKGFLQSEEVKEMCRFAGQIGIRGDLLRELRFKWARQKMEKSEFYQTLEEIVQTEADWRKESNLMDEDGVAVGDKEDPDAAKEEPRAVSLPHRHGKIKYKIYGLDLSDSKWREVAERIHETEAPDWPQEPKPVSGKCKLVTEKIMSLRPDDDPSPLLSEWIELLQPSRIDWIVLMDNLKDKNTLIYLKIAEFALKEKSFQANIRDYSKLVEAHASESRIEDAERILKKMGEDGMVPDILTLSIMVHMYSKSGNVVKAKEAYQRLRTQGFRPNMKIHNSMIMAFVNAGEPKVAESLMRELEAINLEPTYEMYIALLRSFSERGDVSGAERIVTTMEFAGVKPTLESFTLLVEAYGQAGDPDQARHRFDRMMKLGYKPDDRCTASMLAAYERRNSLDKALNLLLELEKNGFEPGVATYTVLLDWLTKLHLIDEAEDVLGKIAELGETPPIKIHISLCAMYAHVRAEKKTLQALGVLEAKKEQLGPEDFERIIDALLDGSFTQDAHRFHELMEARGFKAPISLEEALKNNKSRRPLRQNMRLFNQHRR